MINTVNQAYVEVDGKLKPVEHKRLYMSAETIDDIRKLLRFEFVTTGKPVPILWVTRQTR